MKMKKITRKGAKAPEFICVDLPLSAADPGFPRGGANLKFAEMKMKKM